MSNTQPPAQFDWATELSDAQGHVTLSAQEAKEIGARLRSMGAKLKTYEDLGEAADDMQLLRMGYAAARLEIESLRKEHADELAVAYMCGASREKELAAQQTGAAGLIGALEDAQRAINSMKVEAETAAQGDEQMMLEACETISNEGLQADMAIRAALASHGQAPAQAAPAAVAWPSRQFTDGTRSLRQDCISAIRDFASSRPEDDEDWESWFEAAFGLCESRLSTIFDEHAAAPTTQPAPQQEARPVTPYTCPKCHALWLHWPAEQSGFGMDTLNCRSTTHCDYCEKGGVEQLERLERVPAALKAPQQEAQEPVGYTHASWIAEAKRGGGGSFVGRKNAAFDVPIYTAPPPSPAAQGDALESEYQRGYRQGYEQRDAEVRGAFV